VSRRKHRRTPRWAQPVGKHAVAVGLPGKAPSRKARLLASSPDALPPGHLWHVADYTAQAVATAAPTITAATHAASGEPFLLATAADGSIVAISAESDAALQVIARQMTDPVGWAREEDWWVDPQAGLAS
jgi:hypothetical protein